MLNTEEVCRLYDIKPATWRAYMARGQCPEPKFRGKHPQWSILDLILWRNIELSSPLRIALYSELYRRNARERAWQARTRAHLVQIGLTHEQGWLFADNYTTKMSVPTFNKAYEVFVERKRFRQEIANIPPVIDDLSREELNHLISRRTKSTHPTVLMDKLARLYIARGFDELSPPNEADERYLSQNPREFEEMLNECEPLLGLSIENQEKP